MTKIKDVLATLYEFAPHEWKEDFDNIGLLAGDGEKAVTKALVALDLTDAVMEQAKTLGAELIVTHHPLFFSEKELVSDRRKRRLVGALNESETALIAMHTNADSAPRGVSYALAKKLGMEVEGVMDVKTRDDRGRAVGCGCIGTVEKTSAPEFAALVKERLGCGFVRYADGGNTVRRVGVVSGGGAFMVGAAMELGCDAYVSGDLNYDSFLMAEGSGMSLIDAGHFFTENVITPVFAELIRSAHPDIEVICANLNTDAVIGI